MKQNVPIPVVIVIVLVLVAIVFGVYSMNTKAKNTTPLSLEESKALMKKMGAEMPGVGGSLAKPAPGVKTGP